MGKEKICLFCREANPEDALYCLNCGKGFAAAGTTMISLLKNRYQIIRKIKSGAMGCVYEALDMVTNGRVAIKQLNCSNDGNECGYRRRKFLEEADILSKFHHPGIPAVMDFFISHTCEGGCPVEDYFLVMELIDGPDFETVIKNELTLPLAPEKVVEYAKQILGTLKFLHSQAPPVVFRDLKPSNLMMKNGRLVFVDFGIARVLENRDKGTQIGTPGYAPPEQYKGFAEPASDYYSLGALMHYLLSGIDPEDSSQAPFCFEPLTTINKNVPAGLSALIESMLDLAIKNRPKNADELFEKLNSVWKPLEKPNEQPIKPVNNSSTPVSSGKNKTEASTTIRNYVFAVLGLLFYLAIAGIFSNPSGNMDNSAQTGQIGSQEVVSSSPSVETTAKPDKKASSKPVKSAVNKMEKAKKAKSTKAAKKKSPSAKPKSVAKKESKKNSNKPVIAKETNEYSDSDSPVYGGDYKENDEYNYDDLDNEKTDFDCYKIDYIDCNYNIQGIISGGSGNKVILGSSGYSYNASVGTVLPDGWTIKEITANSVTLKNGKTQKKLYLRN